MPTSPSKKWQTDGSSEQMTNPKSERFETFFANAFGFRLGDNDCTLRFLISEDATKLDLAEIQAAVILTPKSVKSLAGILLDAVLEYEHFTGAELPTNSDRYRKMFQAAKVGWTSELPTAPPTASLQPSEQSGPAAQD